MTIRVVRVLFKKLGIAFRVRPKAEAANKRYHGNPKHFKRLLIALPLVLLGWVAIMALVMRFSDAAPAAVALFPPPGFVENLPPDASVISKGSFYITISGDVPSMGAALYAAGAWLVLPAGLTGCLPLPSNLPRNAALPLQDRP